MSSTPPKIVVPIFVMHVNNVSRITNQINSLYSRIDEDIR